MRSGEECCTEPTSETGDSCSVFALQFQKALPFTCACGVGALSLPLPSPPSLFFSIFFFSHCLSFGPRLNSLTHFGESSPPLWQGCHGDHSVQSWVGVCFERACVAYSALGKLGLRSVPVTSLLITHTWGRRWTVPHIHLIPIYDSGATELSINLCLLFILLVFLQ